MLHVSDGNWSDYPASEESGSNLVGGSGGAGAGVSNPVATGLASRPATAAATSTAAQGMGRGNRLLMDHDYDEISDEERANVAESPRFEVSPASEKTWNLCSKQPFSRVFMLNVNHFLSP